MAEFKMLLLVSTLGWSLHTYFVARAAYEPDAVCSRGAANGATSAEVRRCQEAVGFAMTAGW